MNIQVGDMLAYRNNTFYGVCIITKISAELDEFDACWLVSQNNGNYCHFYNTSLGLSNIVNTRDWRKLT